MKFQIAIVCLFVAMFSSAHARIFRSALVRDEGGNVELDPHDPRVNETIELMDQYHRSQNTLLQVPAPQETQLQAPPVIFYSEPLIQQIPMQDLIIGTPLLIPTPEQAAPRSIRRRCERETCSLYIHISKSTQRLSLYIDGQLKNAGLWRVSTGRRGFSTRNLDTHPNGRIYDEYSSKKYPGHKNMPYAVFIHEGYAIHGAPGAAAENLGRPASHGCIRVSINNARRINRLVRKYGVRNTWFTVED